VPSSSGNQTIGEFISIKGSPRAEAQAKELIARREEVTQLSLPVTVSSVATPSRLLLRAGLQRIP
jgi:hypothetical protein